MPPRAIQCGFGFFGIDLWIVKMRSGKTARGDYPCLSVSLRGLYTPFLEDPNLQIALEIIPIGNRTHIRLNGADLAAIKDAFDGKKLVDKITSMTGKDPCGEIELP